MTNDKGRKGGLQASFTFKPREGRARPFWGLFVLVVALITLIAIVDFDPLQSKYVTTAAGSAVPAEGGGAVGAPGDMEPLEMLEKPTLGEGGEAIAQTGPVDVAESSVAEPEVNAVGEVGAQVGFWSKYLFGGAAFFIPLYLFWVSYMLFAKESHKLRWPKVLAITASLICLACIFSLLASTGVVTFEPRYVFADAGGLLGLNIYTVFLQDALNVVGSALVFLVCLVAATIVLLYDNLGNAQVVRDRADELKSWAERRRAAKEEKQKAEAEARAAKKTVAAEKRKAQQAKKAQEPKQPAVKPARVEAKPPQAVEKPQPKKPEKAVKAFDEKEEAKPDTSGLPTRPTRGPAARQAPEKPAEENPTPMVKPERGDGKQVKVMPPQPDGAPETPQRAARDHTPKSESRSLRLRRRSKAETGEADGEAPDQPAPKTAPGPPVRKDKSLSLKLPQRPRGDGGAGERSFQSSATRFTGGLQPQQPALRPGESMQDTTINDVKIIQSEPTKRAEFVPPVADGYVFPTVNLLNDPAGHDASVLDDHRRTAQTLVNTLEEFGVKVTMGEVHVGPVITRYDVHPAPGIRVEKIQNLDKNIALNLKALSVRILAPVPGKGCVGIEVPNKKPSAVNLRDILESEAWINSKAEIPVALGKEVSGRPLVADLTKMPHLLIAGSTGAGKTVCINSIIASLLYKASPKDIRFVMVDPKIVEMQQFNALPHMLIPVVTDPKKVPAALKYLLAEMERRYKVFAKAGVRNIAGFNAKISHQRAAEYEMALQSDMSPEERIAVSSVEVTRDDEIEVPKEKMPYVVCIVDELADLMMVAPADIETCIARLAQLARAAGIHLILATQRPSVNVITGVIKANLPSRIAFKVASKVDSRTILDGQGAEHLIGKGDMLFLPPGTAELVRSQGAFLGDDEITELVEFISQHNGEPVFDEAFKKTVEKGDEEDSDDGGSDSDSEEDYGDPLVGDAIEVLRSTKRASTSMLQRRLRIGYNRAARIMEILEEREIVGPENGSSPREILVDLDAL